MTDLPSPDPLQPASLPPGGRPPATITLWRGSGFEAAKRVIFLLALVLLMLIPLGMIENVVQERAERKHAVAAEIGDQWGAVQTVSGPILVIPYEVVEIQTKTDGSKESRLVRHYASFLPAETKLQARADVEKRYKSIYEILVYSADLTLTGHFATPDFSRWNIEPAQVKWREASLAFILPGSRALRSIDVKLNGESLQVDAGLLPQHPAGGGVHADLPLSGPQVLTFDIALSLNGHDAFSILPLGGQNEVEIKSTWPHPDFLGTPLPVDRQISPDGFVAHWSINHLATGTPLAWRDNDFRLDPATLNAVGVGLVEPGDVQQQTDRIVKYGILVVGLTFGTIFVVGLIKRDRVHLVQYLLIGAALSLFYLLLLSLAEQMCFALAYLIASLVDIVIVTWYVVTTIRPLIGWLTGGILASLHGYMFVLLQMESYALLCGTIGLFVLLVLAMIATRKIDWYTIGNDNPRHLQAA